MSTKVSLLIIVLFLIQSAVWAQEKKIQVVSERNDDKSMSFNCIKNVSGTYYIELWFTNIENAHSSGFHGNVSVSNRNLLRLKPTNNSRPINCRYKYWYIRGELQPEFDPEFTYLLPLSVEKTYKVRSLTNLGNQYFGSKKPKNWHAYQFMANPGDTVFAARKGKVVKIDDGNNYLTDFSVSYQSSKNNIIIEHPDGTLADYTGFTKGDIWVEEGQTVYPHTPLGLLGKYDIETAQLRFSVYYLNDIPRTKDKPRTLKEKFQYYAFIEPWFFTESGVQPLVPDEYYETVLDEKIITAEFSKKELRQLKKGEISLLK
ncbi:M23 family metallopeptidase [uncultured Draconibacterium sp.]|uniref:M23 family metallopeptidase n=1 Tax=uncultured Draconibacterium sp. TaxID=1573823 RepID=UPI0025D2D698|nr:M23 family metallopeptidase [uncultured Draconibacterium sp.]